MSLQNEQKLKKILQRWPTCGISTSQWFKEQGVSRQLVNRYLKSNWIEAIGSGVYIIPGNNIDWLDAVNALQQQLKLNIYIAAKTALKLHGFQKDLSMEGNEVVHLFNPLKNNIPKWFLQYKWGKSIKIQSVNLFQNSLNEVSQVVIKGYKVFISSSEQAAIELVYFVKDEASFEETKYLFDFFSTLRPKKLQKLLENCKSIQTKRLFLFFAEFSGHNWLKKIDRSKIDLGKGDRNIFPKGKYISKFKITVPHFILTED